MDYKQGKKQTNLMKVLAAAVRNIQWSYSIFWSISPSDPCALEWIEGYYNGDVKTRKTVQAVELDIDQMSLQRSEQLRELYKSLLTGESSNPQVKWPSAALSPEDLSNTEWYYLVCMSFIFSLGEGLPGKSYFENRPIWLSNAPQADSQLFNRSLLAKSASIQTIVCFPYLGGVIELGTTELVSEDFSLIQYVQTSLLEIDSHISSELQHNMVTEKQWESVVTDCRLLESPKSSSTSLAPILPPELKMSFNEEFTDDEANDRVYPSMASSDCISQILASPVNVASDPMIEFVDDSQTHKLDGTDILHLARMGTELLSTEDLHYPNVLSALSKTNNQLILTSSSVADINKESCCFVRWTKGVGVIDLKQNSTFGTEQRMLKKVLFEVPQMHIHSLFDQENGYEDGFGKDNKVASCDHVLTERRRREKVNKRFSVLKSLVPSINKVDKVSILDNTIAYLKELETRIAELEAHGEPDDWELERSRSYKPEDEEIEGTSDTYDCYVKRTGMKRKICDLGYKQQEENQTCCQISLSGDCSDIGGARVSVNLVEKDGISINVKCPWKEGLVLQILGALGNLQLDGHSIECLTADNILSISMKAKAKESNNLSVGKIRQVIQRAVRIC